MEQIERIQQMEAVLDEVKSGITQLTAAAENYLNLLPKIRKLAAYYGSADWNQDFDDDRAGKLPADLKRGVLSEDDVYDTLVEHRETLRQMLALVSTYLRGEDID